MESVITCVSLLGLLVLLGCTGMVVGAGGSSPACGFPAIYNFGDSNSDTGAISAAISEVPPPNGETFFGHPSGRACDGRLIIDFIAEELKLPYLSPYLDSIGTNFRHGANFATGGSSILKGGFSPFDLGVQISQFRRFKSRTTALYNNRKIPPFKALYTNLPVPGDFSKALYTFDIGQNDLSVGFMNSTVQQTRASIPNILATFSWAVQQLYEEGARFFWVHNTGPLGCLPYGVIYGRLLNLQPGRDSCVRPINEGAQEFNRQLKKMVIKLRTQLPLATLTYTDVYSVKYSLITNAKKQGFVDPQNFCCGRYDARLTNLCGERVVVNGTVYREVCAHPSDHISWDGVHYTEAANQWVAGRILHGSFSDPPVSVREACRHGK